MTTARARRPVAARDTVLYYAESAAPGVVDAQEDEPHAGLGADGQAHALAESLGRQSAVEVGERFDRFGADVCDYVSRAKPGPGGCADRFDRADERARGPRAKAEPRREFGRERLERGAERSSGLPSWRPVFSRGRHGVCKVVLMEGKARVGFVSGCTPVIGLAGGVGSGKSAAAACLSRLGCVVIDSDARAKALLDTPALRDRLVRWWGDRVVRHDGCIDREVISDIVFSDADQRRRLEGLIHPMLEEAREATIREAIEAGAAGVVIDAPLLYEAGLDARCDAVIFVDAPREARLARVSRSRGWDEAELDRRESAQMPLEIKRERAHYVLTNTGPADELCEQARRVLGMIHEGMARRSPGRPAEG